MCFLVLLSAKPLDNLIDDFFRCLAVAEYLGSVILRWGKTTNGFRELFRVVIHDPAPAAIDHFLDPDEIDRHDDRFAENVTLPAGASRIGDEHAAPGHELYEFKETLWRHDVYIVRLYELVVYFVIFQFVSCPGMKGEFYFSAALFQRGYDIRHPLQ